MRCPPGPLCVTQLGKDWIDQGTLARTRTTAPAELLAGPVDTLHDDWFRAVRVRRALDRSGPMAQSIIQQRLAGIELSDIWPILVQACRDIALYYGGSVVGGAAVGSVAGLFAGGVGAVPGAAAGAAVGAQLGGWVLALLGLKSLVEYLGTAIPQAMRLYERGFREAWGPGARAGRWRAVPSGDVHTAARHFADGHVIVIAAMLSALAACLTRGRGDKARLLQEVRDSRRLGPKVADWVERNEDRLLAHPELKAQEPRIAMAAPAPRDIGPAMTPSQLRRARELEAQEAPRPALPARMAVKKVPCFHPFDKKKFMQLSAQEQKGYLKEMAEQLQRQQDAINSLTAAEYKAAREAFGQHGRNPLAEAAQASYRDDFADRISKSIRESLTAGSISASKAKQVAAQRTNELMNKLVALHEPDMVAGGWMQPDPKGMGRLDVNSSIGASWNQNGRVAGMDTYANEAIKSGLGDEKMNVKLEPCRGKGLR